MSGGGQNGELDTLALHASAVKTPGGALLFLGHAGQGKSTVCQLLAERFPPLADDAIYLLCQEDGLCHVANGDQRAFAGPLQTDEARELEWTPLRGIVRIFRATTTELAPIDAQETCRHLTDAVFEIQWQKRKVETARKLFSAAAQVARRYPGWKLCFSLAPETEELLGKVFGR